MDDKDQEGKTFVKVNKQVHIIPMDAGKKKTNGGQEKGASLMGEVPGNPNGLGKEKIQEDPEKGEEMKILNEDPNAQEYDPHLHRLQEHPTNDRETLIHLIKGSLGTGILAMPDAFEKSGLLVGTIGTILIGMLCSYGMLLLVNCQYKLCKQLRTPVISYPNTMKHALKRGPRPLRFVANLSRPIVDGFLVIYQLGVCCVYIVFMGDTLITVFDAYWQLKDVRYYMLMTLLPLVAIMMIRNLKLLAPFSQAANLITFIGLAIIMYYIFRDFQSHPTVTYFGSPIKYGLFMGTTLFALESPGVILALEYNMKTPKSFGGWKGVFNQGMAVVTALYVIMGFVGYLKYGATIEGSITLNLPGGEMLAQAVKLIFAAAIYVTFALQCYVPVDIIWNMYVKKRFNKRRRTILYEYMLRIFLVVLTFGFAAAVPYLSLFISLFGAMCLSALGIAFPALVELCILWPDNFGKWKHILIKDITLIVIAIIAGGVGTTKAIYDIIGKFQGEANVSGVLPVNATVSLLTNLTTTTLPTL